MKRKQTLYPGVSEAEAERKRIEREFAAGIKPAHFPQEEPDWIGSAPNYDKFTKKGFTIEETLVWLNID